MATNSITPGNWWYSENSDELLSMPSQVKICKRISGSTLEQAKANQSLIQHSPETMDALVDLTSFCLNNGYTENPYYQRAITLIEKIISDGNL